jgi:hypothetical protein
VLGASTGPVGGEGGGEDMGSIPGVPDTGAGGAVELNLAVLAGSLALGASALLLRRRILPA